MRKDKQKHSSPLSWTLMTMRLTGIGIVASGAATAAVPELRIFMIPTFAICATIFGITLLSTLSKPKIKKKAQKRPEANTEVIAKSEELMDSYDDDNSHLILISSPYFVQQAKITPDKGVTPDSVVKCQASAKGLPDQEEPTIEYSWRNASTGAFLGTRSQLDLKSTLVRPGQSIECLVTAEDECGDMATSLAKVLIEANLTKPDTPTERFNRKDLIAKGDEFRNARTRRNRGRRATDRNGHHDTLKTERRQQRDTVKKDRPQQSLAEVESRATRRPLKQVYEGDDSSNIFSPMGMWD